jgi:hypothetical protein
MSFFIPLPRHSTRAYREFLKALEQEFVIDSPYKKAQANHLAMVWASYMDAAQQFADQADKGGTNDHQLARTRAIRRVLNIWSGRYSNERERVTAILRIREPEPIQSGKAIVSARGNGTSSTRVEAAYARMQREKRGERTA